MNLAQIADAQSRARYRRAATRESRFHEHFPHSETGMHLVLFDLIVDKPQKNFVGDPRTWGIQWGEKGHINQEIQRLGNFDTLPVLLRGGHNPTDEIVREIYLNRTKRIAEMLLDFDVDLHRRLQVQIMPRRIQDGIVDSIQVGGTKYDFSRLVRFRLERRRYKLYVERLYTMISGSLDRGIYTQEHERYMVNELLALLGEQQDTEQMAFEREREIEDNPNILPINRYLQPGVGALNVATRSFVEKFNEKFFDSPLDIAYDEFNEDFLFKRNEFREPLEVGTTLVNGVKVVPIMFDKVTVDETSFLHSAFFNLIYEYKPESDVGYTHSFEIPVNVIKTAAKAQFYHEHIFAERLLSRQEPDVGFAAKITRDFL